MTAATTELAERDGLSALRAIMAGELPPPPIAVLMGFELVEVEDGRALFAVDPGPQHYNPLGVVHGGLAATLIDSATGCAVHATLPRGATFTTLDLQARYVRAITSDTGRVLCEGTVVHRGRTVATAQATVTTPGGRLLAHGTASLLIRPRDARTASTAPPASGSG